MRPTRKPRYCAGIRARVGLAMLLLVAAAAASAAREFRDRLEDGSEGPTMVEVPAGRLLMGSPDSEAGRRPVEGPVHQVQLKAFALGRTEVSRGEFAAFVRATGHVTDAERDTPVPDKTDTFGCFAYVSGIRPEWKRGSSWRDFGSAQDDSHPVACISHADAQAYVAWLSRSTGKAYRLPTEAEQEYTIRAGSTTPWPWGMDPDGGCKLANGADISGKAYAGRKFGMILKTLFAASNCDDGHGATAPVASLAPNAFGLYDTSGNVSEWSQDCYVSYERQLAGVKPGDVAGCTRYVIRGMAWSDEPVWLRSAIRMVLPPVSRFHNVGMRVARDL